MRVVIYARKATRAAGRCSPPGKPVKRQIDSKERVISMNRGIHLRTAMGVVILGVVGSTTPVLGQSLADVAKKSEEQRTKSDNTPATKVYTNKDLPSTAAASGPGIQPLTPETLEAAKAEAGGKEPVSDPLMIRLKSARFLRRSPELDHFCSPEMTQPQSTI